MSGFLGRMFPFCREALRPTVAEERRRRLRRAALEIAGMGLSVGWDRHRCAYLVEGRLVTPYALLVAHDNDRLQEMVDALVTLDVDGRDGEGS